MIRENGVSHKPLCFKKIGKPVAMYAKSVNLGMPAFDKPVGYDLEIGDWVGVYGKGVNADILFTGYFKDKTNNKSDYTLTVTFPNPADGLQEFTTTEFAQKALTANCDLHMKLH